MVEENCFQESFFICAPRVCVCVYVMKCALVPCMATIDPQQALGTQKARQESTARRRALAERLQSHFGYRGVVRGVSLLPMLDLISSVFVRKGTAGIYKVKSESGWPG